MPACVDTSLQNKDANAKAGLNDKVLEAAACSLPRHGSFLANAEFEALASPFGGSILAAAAYSSQVQRPASACVNPCNIIGCALIKWVAFINT